MKKQRNLGQQGIVAIVSVMLIILIITVITLSLATLTRRGLRQALDEQLSTQALYAAESGINDARTALSTIPDNISDCSEASQSKINSNRSLGGNVRYTCVLIDQTPPSIITDVTTNGVKSFLLKSSDPITDLNITWRSSDSAATTEFSPCTPSLGCLLTASGWGNRIGLLRARLLPVTTSLTRDSLGNAIDVIAYPGGSTEAGYSNSMDASAARQKMLLSTCDNAAKTCTINIGGLGSPGSYYLQLYSYYKDINATVTPFSNGASIKLKGAQISIDSTGAAGDVLRRVKVTVPSDESIRFQNNFVNFPVASLGVGDELCKRFTTNATNTADDDPVNCSAF